MSTWLHFQSHRPADGQRRECPQPFSAKTICFNVSASVSVEGRGRRRAGASVKWRHFISEDEERHGRTKCLESQKKTKKNSAGFFFLFFPKSNTDHESLPNRKKTTFQKMLSNLFFSFFVSFFCLTLEPISEAALFWNPTRGATGASLGDKNKRIIGEKKINLQIVRRRS